MKNKIVIIIYFIILFTAVVIMFGLIARNNICFRSLRQKESIENALKLELFASNSRNMIINKCEGLKFPESKFPLFKLKGRSVNIYQANKKWILIGYYSVDACNSCTQKSMVELNKIYTQYSEKIAVFALLHYKNINEFNIIFRSNRLFYPKLVDTDFKFASFIDNQTQITPILVLIEPMSKVIVKMSCGVSNEADSSNSKLLEYVEKVISNKSK